MGKSERQSERQTEGRPVQEAHGLPIGVLLDHGQVGVQADAHCGVKGHLKGSSVVLGADHGPQLLAVHSLLHLLEELLEGLLVGVCLELQPQTHRGDSFIHALSCPFILSLICPFIHPFTRSLTRSLTHSLTHSTYLLLDVLLDHPTSGTAACYTK